MKPPIPIYDPRFKYVPAMRTDVRETWKKAKEQAKANKPQEGSKCK